MKITTKYDKRTLSAFYSHHNKKSWWIIIVLIIVNVNAFFNICDMRADGTEYGSYMTVIIVLDILYALLYFVFPIFRTHSTAKKGRAFDFLLDEDRINYSITSEEGGETGYYYYKVVRRAERDRHNYYLYISKRQAIILSRAGIEGDEKELEAFLLARLGKDKIKFKMAG